MTSELKCMIDIQPNENLYKEEERRNESNENLNKKRDAIFKKQGSTLINFH